MNGAVKLIPMYGAKRVALHLAPSSHETTAKNRLFQLPRTPENVELVRAMAAGPQLRDALEGVLADWNDGVMATVYCGKPGAFDVAHTRIARAKAALALAPKCAPASGAAR